MAKENDPKLEIESLSDDDLESVSGGDSNTTGGNCNTDAGTCNTSGGTCTTAIGALCNTSASGTCNNRDSENPLPEDGGAS